MLHVVRIVLGKSSKGHARAATDGVTVRSGYAYGGIDQIWTALAVRLPSVPRGCMPRWGRPVEGIDSAYLYWLVKRAFDVWLQRGGAASAPGPLAIVAIAIKLDDPECPRLLKQERGQDGRTFQDV